MKKFFTQTTFKTGTVLPVLMCCITFSGFAQGVVRGMVTDATSNEPLPGVSILVKGTTEGTITDAEGRYSVTSPEDATLVSFGKGLMLRGLWWQFLVDL